MSNTENLALWNAVQKTDPSHTKAITGKSYQGTSPKPHYLVHKATETFGPIGIGWGFTIVDERIEEGAGGEKMHFARVKVWYKWKGERGEVEHVGGTQFAGTRKSGAAFTDEDAPKKSVTDALIKALSMIGFAGDIFMGRYDDSKYVSDLKAETSKSDSRETYDRLSKANRELTSEADFNKFWSQASVQDAVKVLPADWKRNLKTEKDDKAAELAERAAADVDFPGDQPSNTQKAA